MSEKKDDNWEMPQPVFKSSEGSLPRSFEETISTSFMANAETIEIDEDDDILGIMDASLTDKYVRNFAATDEENILETEPKDEPEPVPQIDIPADDPTPTIEERQLIQVTAKGSAETTEAKPDAAGSGLSVYVLLLIIAVVLGALYYFLVLKK